MNEITLMENFLNTIKQYALENPRQNISSDFIYSLLIKYNIPSSNKPLTSLVDKLEVIFERLKNKKSMLAFKEGNFLFLKKGQLNEKIIKLFVPYDKENIEMAAHKIFDFISFNGITHESSIANMVRNDDLVIRVNNLEDAKKIMAYIKSDPFLKNNLLKVNPFLPNNDGIGIAMETKSAFNSILCEIISKFVLKLKMEGRLNDLNLQNFNTYIIEQIPIASYFQKSILETLASVMQGHSVEDFYNYAMVNLENNNEIYRPSDVEQALRRIIITIGDKEIATRALKEFVMRGDCEGISKAGNAWIDFVTKTNHEKVMPLILNYLNFNGIAFKDMESAISAYISDVMKNYSQNKNANIPNEEKKKTSDQYLAEAVAITEKYHPGFGVPALINYISTGESRGFTRKEGARENLVNNVPPEKALHLIEYYLDTLKISHNSNYEAVQKYIDSILGRDISQKQNPNPNNTNEEIELKSPAQYLVNAIMLTERKHPGNVESAIINYVNAGLATGITREGNARKQLVNNVSPNMALDIIKEYLIENNIPFGNTIEAIKNYVQRIIGLEKDNLDVIIECVRNAYVSTKNKYNENQAKTALLALLSNGDFSYFTNQNGDRFKLIELDKKYNLRDCLIRNLGPTLDETLDYLQEIFEGRHL